MLRRHFKKHGTRGAVLLVVVVLLAATTYWIAPGYWK